MTNSFFNYFYNIHSKSTNKKHDACCSHRRPPPVLHAAVATHRQPGRGVAKSPKGCPRPGRLGRRGETCWHTTRPVSQPLFFFPFVLVSILTVETDLCLALLCYLAGRCSPPRVWMVTFKSHQDASHCANAYNSIQSIGADQKNSDTKSPRLAFELLLLEKFPLSLHYLRRFGGLPYCQGIRLEHYGQHLHLASFFIYNLSQSFKHKPTRVKSSYRTLVLSFSPDLDADDALVRSGRLTHMAPRPVRPNLVPIHQTSHALSARILAPIHSDCCSQPPIPAARAPRLFPALQGGDRRRSIVHRILPQR